MDRAAATALKAFSELPLEVQETVKRDGEILGRTVYDHTAGVLIGIPGQGRDPSTVRHGSSVMVQFDGKVYLATAFHVITHYLQERRRDSAVQFSVGQASIPVVDRPVWYDAASDVALVLLRGREPDDIGKLPWAIASWPTPVPQIGDFIVFGGFPKGYRVDIAPDKIDLNFVGGGAFVTSAVERNFKCTLPRDRLVPIYGDHVPPLGTEMGGMSGGPVFRVVPRDIATLTLMGVITDYGNDIDTFIQGPLCNIPSPAFRPTRDKAGQST